MGSNKSMKLGIEEEGQVKKRNLEEKKGGEKIAKWKRKFGNKRETKFYEEPKQLEKVAQKVAITCGVNFNLFQEGEELLIRGNSKVFLRESEALVRGEAKEEKFCLEIEKIVTVVQVSCGMKHFVILGENGIAYACGENKFGAIGKPKEVTRVAKPTLIDSLQDRIVSVHCGWHHTLYLASKFSQTAHFDFKNIKYQKGDKNKLLANGRNDFGQCSVNRRGEKIVWKAEKIEFGWNSSLVRKVCVGSEHNLVLNEKGELFSFGWVCFLPFFYFPTFLGTKKLNTEE